MKTIKIAHLYYDLMNLNGENGNVLCLKEHFKQQKAKVEVDLLTVDDKINFNNYDIFYIGSGSKENMKIVLNDLNKYQENIKKAIDDNKYFIVTGNALGLFGEHIIDLDNKKQKCLNIFKYYLKEIDIEECIVGDQLYKTSLIEENIIGFQNRQTIMINNENSLFTVIEGTGYKKDSNEEGYKYNNFYGTYLLGPLLVRNPYFTDYLVKKILKENNLPYKTNHSSFDYIAYNEFINNKNRI
ncbi:MAG TPA: glutamine amidotransferase [Bacilli bacterium]|nr:glutamine amidotransferase [Bacilli bacterium]